MRTRNQRGEGEGCTITLVGVFGMLILFGAISTCGSIRARQAAERSGARRGAPEGAQTFMLADERYVTVWSDGETWRVLGPEVSR